MNLPAADSAHARSTHNGHDRGPQARRHGLATAHAGARWAVCTALLLAACASIQASAAPSFKPAEIIYHNGYVYTADAKDSVHQALAVRAGRIAYVGSNAGAAALAGKGTRVIDLQGRMLMPGLIDAHMHPLSGGKRLLHCNLNYEALTVAEFQARIQACADKDAANGTGSGTRWLLVVNWFQQGMRQAGVDVTRATLDALSTERPIVVRSSFGHSNLVNSKGLEVAGISRSTPDPAAGKIWRDANGDATGLLEDAAMDLVDKLLPELTPQQAVRAADAAMGVMRKQGVTSFLDASSDPEILRAFSALQRQGKLSARAHFAPSVAPEDAANPARAIAPVLKLARRYHQRDMGTAPVIQVRQAKLYMDGVIAAPAFTGNMVEPYYADRGHGHHPRWAPGSYRGPATYFSTSALAEVMRALARAGIDPHVHVDGDGAVRATLDALQTLRATPEGKQVRPVLAHAEIVHPSDFKRFAALDASAALSFQWGKPAADTVGLKDYLGPERYAILEPQGLLLDHGARIVFGSDWPVDPLDQWFAFKVAVTRTAAPDAGQDFAGRLGPHPGMPRVAVLRSATINAAYTLRQEKRVGSLEQGKLADLIVLDRNVFEVPEEDIAKVQVLQTVVGGRIVHEESGLR